MGLGAGDPEAALGFLRRFQRRVYGTALAVTGDPHLAEDVAQQAFERVWTHASSYEPNRASVATWLMRITRNLAIDASRLRRPQPVDTEELLMRIGAGSSDTEGAVITGAAADQLRSSLRRLPVEQARALVLAGIAGLTAREIAEREGIPLGTAKTRIRVAMQRVRADVATHSEHGCD